MADNRATSFSIEIAGFTTGTLFQNWSIIMNTSNLRQMNLHQELSRAWPYDRSIDPDTLRTAIIMLQLLPPSLCKEILLASVHVYAACIGCTCENASQCILKLYNSHRVTNSVRFSRCCYDIFMIIFYIRYSIYNYCSVNRVIIVSDFPKQRKYSRYLFIVNFCK